MTGPDPLKIPDFCDAAAWLAQARSAQAAAAIRQVLALGQEQAALANAFAGGAGANPAATLDQLAREFADRHRQLFALPAGVTASARYQAALQRHGGVLAGIAADAARRFTAELADDRGAPITTLAGLHALWVDCGERAFGAAASGEAFVASQAELLAAWVELRASG